jgi:DNA-binding NtrC family response regulator
VSAPADIRPRTRPEDVGPLPLVSILAQLEELREDRETLLDVAERVLLTEALHRTGGRQHEAAALLGISTRMMSHKLMLRQARPKDRKGAAA